MVQTSRKLELLLILILLQINFWLLGNCFSCETPNDWLSGDITIQQKSRGQVVSTQPWNHQPETWPNGVVPYKLDPSQFTFRDRLEIQNAFREYHTKTCIRFTPWQEGDTDFIRIELDNNVCGYSNVCKIGGEQVVRFGKDCRRMETIIHQLGHALCLGHEHQRLDRDQFVNFSSCDTIPPKIKSFRRPLGIYDFNSQMHSQCHSCQGGGFPIGDEYINCGADISLGLSVLDVDNISFLYNCQGCHRHRWIPAASLAKQDFEIMYTFGYQFRNGTSMYLCRARSGSGGVGDGGVVSGIYNVSRKSCHISWYTVAHEIEDQVEVLTIPGGLIGTDCSSYKLENWRKAPVHTYLNVGNFLRGDDVREFTTHSAFSTIIGEDNVSHKSIGYYWNINGEFHAKSADFTAGDKTFKISQFDVLTCNVETPCVLPTSNFTVITSTKIENDEHDSFAKTLFLWFAAFLIICGFLALGIYLLKRYKTNMSSEAVSFSVVSAELENN